MATHQLALHETMELHEFLTFKTICMTKSNVMQGLVSDKQLIALMQKDVDQSSSAIQEAKRLLSSSQYH